MKKLIDRLKGGSGDADFDPAPDDSRFFSTLFMERGDDTQMQVPWSARAAEIEAQPLDKSQGAKLFAKAWGSDRYVAALQPADIERLARYLDFVAVPANQEVIGQDEQGDYMLVVLEGTIAVDRVQPWGGRARLAEARAGDMLGEMSLLDAGARFSACTTLTQATLAVIDANRLDALITHEPRLGLALLASLARRLSLRLRQVSARLSALLSEN
jgi:CRP-like cAMP-binding protein